MKAHTSKRLRNRLVHVKDPTEAERRKGAVYQIKCPCGSSYVGESGRPKNVRLKEHIADIKFARTDKSATARHFETCGEDMDPLAAKTLALQGHWKRRKIREAIEIRQLGRSSTDRPGVNIVMSAVSIKIATIGQSWALITNIKSVFEYILPFKNYSLRQFWHMSWHDSILLHFLGQRLKII